MKMTLTKEQIIKILEIRGITQDLPYIESKIEGTLDFIITKLEQKKRQALKQNLHAAVNLKASLVYFTKPFKDKLEDYQDDIKKLVKLSSILCQREQLDTQDIATFLSKELSYGKCIESFDFNDLITFSENPEIIKIRLVGVKEKLSASKSNRLQKIPELVYSSTFIGLGDSFFSFASKYFIKDKNSITALEQKLNNLKKIKNPDEEIKQEIIKTENEIDDLNFPTQAAGFFGACLGFGLTWQLGAIPVALMITGSYLGSVWERINTEQRINWETATLNDAAIYDVEAGTVVRAINFSVAILQAYSSANISPVVNAIGGLAGSIAATKLLTALKKIDPEKISEGQLYAIIFTSILGWEVGKQAAGYMHYEYDYNNMVNSVIDALEKTSFANISVQFEPRGWGSFWSRPLPAFKADNVTHETSCTFVHSEKLVCDELRYV